MAHIHDLVSNTYKQTYGSYVYQDMTLSHRAGSHLN